MVFDAILRERNITQAALRVGLSQPATSSAIGRLRKVSSSSTLAARCLPSAQLSGPALPPPDVTPVG
ncbi:MAG: LysR family transcriptional regulator [Casimicrobiaceae bacterium]